MRTGIQNNNLWYLTERGCCSAHALNEDAWAVLFGSYFQRLVFRGREPCSSEQVVRGPDLTGVPGRDAPTMDVKMGRHRKENTILSHQKESIIESYNGLDWKDPQRSGSNPLPWAKLPTTRSGTRSGCPGPHPTWPWIPLETLSISSVLSWFNAVAKELKTLSFYLLTPFS